MGGGNAGGRAPAGGTWPGARGYDWVKLKRAQAGNLQDTVDGVIVGYIFCYTPLKTRSSLSIGGASMATASSAPFPHTPHEDDV